MSPWQRLATWLRTHRRAAAAAGVGGAAGLALLARSRRPATTDKNAGEASTIGQVPGDPADLVNAALRSIQPQLDALTSQVSNLTPANASSSVRPLTAHEKHLLHQRHVAHQTAVQQRQRQSQVRADPSKVRNASDVGLLTPAQRRDFARYVNAQRSTTTAQQIIAASRATPLPARMK